jgi:hypothetical protein
LWLTVPYHPLYLANTTGMSHLKVKHFVFSDYFRKSCRLWDNVDFFDEEYKKLLRFKVMSKFNRTYPVVFYLLLTSKYWDRNLCWFYHLIKNSFKFNLHKETLGYRKGTPEYWSVKLLSAMPPTEVLTLKMEAWRGPKLM